MIRVTLVITRDPDAPSSQADVRAFVDALRAAIDLANAAARWR